MEVGLRFLPLHFDDTRMHFGNINSVSQASFELSHTTDLVDADRTGGPSPGRNKTQSGKNLFKG